NPATFRAAIHDEKGKLDLTQRSPLTAEQESDLRRRQNGVVIVVGCKSAGLHRLGTFLESACGREFFVTLDTVDDEPSLTRHLEGLPNREKHGVTLVMVPADRPWTPRWVADAQEKIARLKSLTAFVRVVFIAGPSQAWSMADEWASEVQKLQELGVRRIGLTPWHEPAIRQWLDGCGFGNEAQEHWNQILKITGGWPLLLDDFLQKSGPEHDRWRDAIEQIEKDLVAPDRVGEWRNCFGLDASGRKDILRDWASLGAGAIQDIADVIEAPLAEVQMVVRWAELLSLATPEGNGFWRPDPVVAKVLQASDA
ncbi:MAG: hypothetical protein ACUVS7_17125, partial [Bryobacteraceae bacterium]